ncbi:MAG: type II toxin-antitoxin system VapC family toxin [Ilumatobacteraceae bacterium]
MITYVDTSTLIKLLIDEVGTAEAAAIWDEADTLVTVRVAHVEARAALAAARRQSRITAAVFRSAIAGLEVLWSQLSVVEVDENLMRLAGDQATTHGLRGYDAVHLAAAHLVGAGVFSSADRRLCEAASTSGFHVANPLDTASPEIGAGSAVELGDDPRPPATKDSGVHGIPVPATSQPIDDAGDGYRVSGYTIQELTAAYKDWMSTDGWIFDAEYSHLDPYLSEERPHVGYITQSIYVKPTTPPTTIAVIIGKFDGKPGNKRDLKVYLTQTPDDELPRRSVQLSWADDTT